MTAKLSEWVAPDNGRCRIPVNVGNGGMGREAQWKGEEHWAMIIAVEYKQAGEPQGPLRRETDRGTPAATAAGPYRY